MQVIIGYKYLSDGSRAPYVHLQNDHDMITLDCIDEDCAEMLVDTIENCVFETSKVIDNRLMDRYAFRINRREI